MKYDNTFLRQYAKYRRKNQTYGEMKLWSLLRRKQLFKYKFLRQHIITNYIVDFFCHELKLIIEIDGSSHDENRFQKDYKRELSLKSLGYRFFRFSELDVRYRIDDVLQTIVNCMNIPSPISPSAQPPLPKGEGIT